MVGPVPPEGCWLISASFPVLGSIRNAFTAPVRFPSNSLISKIVVMFVWFSAEAARASLVQP